MTSELTAVLEKCTEEERANYELRAAVYKHLASHYIQPKASNVKAKLLAFERQSKSSSLDS